MPTVRMVAEAPQQKQSFAKLCWKWWKSNIQRTSGDLVFSWGSLINANPVHDVKHLTAKTSLLKIHASMLLFLSHYL